MINCKQGDIVLVEFNYSDGTGSKKRPVLVISNDEYNQNRNELIILGITSNTLRILPGDQLIKSWKEAGLLKPSLLSGIVQTINKKLVYMKLGEISKKDILVYINAFMNVIGVN